MDHLKQTWKFVANVGQNVDRVIFGSAKFGFKQIQDKGSRINLYCRKNVVGGMNGGKCPFAGIYLKANGCLYTRGRHEHGGRGELKKNAWKEGMKKRSGIYKLNEIQEEIQTMFSKYSLFIINPAFPNNFANKMFCIWLFYLDLNLMNVTNGIFNIFLFDKKQILIFYLKKNNAFCLHPINNLL